MSYKQMDNNFSFTDLSLVDSLEHNRSVSRMEKINAIIDWRPLKKSKILQVINFGVNFSESPDDENQDFHCERLI